MSDSRGLTPVELAVEFTDLWKTLETSQINQMLARNVSFELLEFFSEYAQDFADEILPNEMDQEEIRRRLPNLLIIGYIIRILEERVE
jgi:hypothetical protein